jgi:hypothetical protein
MARNCTRFAARNLTLAACIVLPLCGCAATPVTFENDWAFDRSESQAPKSQLTTKPAVPAVVPRSEPAGDSAQGPVIQAGNVDQSPLFPGPARRSDASRQ